MAITGVVYDIIDSPVGPLFVGASGAGLHRVEFLDRDDPRHDEAAHLRALAHDGGVAPAAVRHDPAALRETVAALRAYFDGRATSFALPLAPRGTEFQRAVWRALLAVPSGGTCSYGALARAAGYPGAARAVGAAVGRNPIAVIIPCHRVIGADGTLTGYGGGLHRKRWLLDHEARALVA
jgi:methylated-DNA-[protein]-cysteine S-methyltransferase